MTRKSTTDERPRGELKALQRMAEADDANSETFRPEQRYKPRLRALPETIPDLRQWAGDYAAPAVLHAGWTAVNHWAIARFNLSETDERKRETIDAVCAVRDAACAATGRVISYGRWSNLTPAPPTQEQVALAEEARQGWVAEGSIVPPEAVRHTGSLLWYTSNHEEQSYLSRRAFGVTQSAS